MSTAGLEPKLSVLDERLADVVPDVAVLRLDFSLHRCVKIPLGLSNRFCWALLLCTVEADSSWFSVSVR